MKESRQEKAAGAGAYDCDSGSGGGGHGEDGVVTLLVGWGTVREDRLCGGFATNINCSRRGLGLLSEEYISRRPDLPLHACL